MPAAPVVPVYAATWEPTPATAKKAQAAKRLLERARGAVAGGAKPRGDAKQAAVSVLASAPPRRSSVKRATDRADWLRALNRPMSVRGLDIGGGQKSQEPLAAQWKKPLTLPTKFKATGQALAVKPQAQVQVAAHHAPVDAAEKKSGEEKKDWMKALGLATGPEAIQSKAQHLAQQQAQPTVTTPKKAAAQPNEPKAKGMSKDWMQALGLTGQPKPPVQHHVVSEHGHTSLASSRAANEARTGRVTTASQARAMAEAAPVLVQKKPVTGEAILQDWMKALGLSSSHSSHPASAPLKLQQAQQRLAQKHARVQKADQTLHSVELPVHAAHWEPKSTGLDPHAHTGVKARRGIQASWFAALHRKPDTVFDTAVFSEGGDEQAGPVAKMLPARKAWQAAPKNSKQQQLVAKGSWAQAMGKGPGAVHQTPEQGADMWGDVLVRMQTPLVPDGQMVPNGVTARRVVAGSEPSDLQPSMVEGKRAAWIKALGRPAHFKTDARNEMLVGKPQPERYSEAILREALADGESPRAAQLEHEMKGTMTALEPFGDEQVPAETAPYRTLWGN
jgi:hypothetical protein